ncbi:MAG: hypothetical protein AAGA18_02530 [Verrucomicrobiota bacterium]
MDCQNKEISIVGAGLAGLSLGIGLRNSGVPVTLYEASHFPRHRVCGEFISGVSPKILQFLGVDDLLHGAQQHRKIRWYYKNTVIFESELPVLAWGISRFKLDELMANRLKEVGGTLIESHRIAKDVRRKNNEGWVWASGRKVHIKSKWLGLKVHVCKLEMKADLEMHLGENGYVGLSRVERGRVNVCGLFRKEQFLQNNKQSIFKNYLYANGLEYLSERISKAGKDERSLSSVSAFHLGWNESNASDFEIGDRLGVIPPFTGNGMSMAFEGAAEALNELKRYSYGDQTWKESRDRFLKRARKKFSWRMQMASRLHPFLLNSSLRMVLLHLCKLNLLPFNLLLRLLR